MNWDYLAGLVDGEGSLCMSYSKGNADHVVYRPMIAISNNHRGVLEQARGLMGGAIYDHPRSNPNERPGWSLRLTGHNPLIAVLSHLLPRLIIKQEQARLMLGFCERRRIERTRSYEQIDIDMIAEMQRLNNRSPGKGRPIRPLIEARPNTTGYPGQLHKYLNLP